jgi:hypothetical protein
MDYIIGVCLPPNLGFMLEWTISITSLFLFWNCILLEFCNQFPLYERVHASICCISLCFLQSVTSLFWFLFDYCPSSSCVILINFFYHNFCKDYSSNKFHKGTCPEQEQQEQTINIYLEEMLVQFANKYNKHLYQ